MNRVAMATSTLLGIDINVVVMIYLPTYLAFVVGQRTCVNYEISFPLDEFMLLLS